MKLVVIGVCILVALLLCGCVEKSPAATLTITRIDGESISIKEDDDNYGIFYKDTPIYPWVSGADSWYGLAFKVFKDYDYATLDKMSDEEIVRIFEAAKIKRNAEVEHQRKIAAQEASDLKNRTHVKVYSV